MARKTYTTFEVGDICGVYPTTVINWVNQKKLPAFVTPGGHRRIRREDLVDFLKEFSFPTPPDLLGDRRRVMIVDGDKGFARVLAKAFQKHRTVFEVDVRTDGIDALVAIGKKPPDIVLLDVVMPVVDGRAVCATLRSNPDTRHIRIVAMTGEKLPEQSARRVRQKSDVFLHKPFDVSALVERVAVILGVELGKS